MNSTFNVDDTEVMDHPIPRYLKTKMDSLVKATILNWYSVVVSLGLSDDQELTSGWCQTFVEHIEAASEEVVADINDYKTQVMTQIEEYLSEIQNYCKSLGEEMPNIGDQNLGLVKERNQLRTLVDQYKSKYENRSKEVRHLIKKEEKLCTILGDKPMPIVMEPLPNKAQIEKLQSYIESLEMKRFVREERYLKLKTEIRQMLENLNKPIMSEWEQSMCVENDIIVSAEKMALIEEYHFELEKETRTVNEEIESLWSNIESTWDILEIDRMEREKFKNKHNGNSLEILKALKDEYKRCEEIKKANIKIFVEKYRKELEHMWDVCHCSFEQRNSFKFFNIECYTENLLELFEIELEKWKLYFSENKKLINLLNEHKKLWQTLVEMENQASGPGRYANRGGQLLKEERERNKLNKKIPLIETELMKLADEFLQKNGKPFLSFGNTVEGYINSLHEARENEKMLKLSARKEKRDQSVTPKRKCTTKLFPSSSTMSLVTPSSPNKRQKVAATPVSSSINRNLKRKVLTSTTNTPNSGKKPKVPTSRAKRLSKERGKRIRKSLTGSKSRKIDENSSLDSDYSEFKDDISSGRAGRSTLMEQEITRRTPRKIPAVMLTTPTPPNARNKLTAAHSSTKLNF